MSSRKRVILTVTSLGLALGVGYAIRAAASGIPSTGALSYAGVLEDANGPINGPPLHNVQIILYDAATAGNNLCQSAPSNALTITNGHFAVQLPDTCTAAVGANPNVWADVLVDGSDTGRTKIGAVPYAVEANHTVNADNATTASTATNAGHASTADTATTATNATTAATAQAAAGSLQTTISQMQSAIATLQGQPPPLTTLFGSNLNTTDPSSASWQSFATQCIQAIGGTGASNVIDACLIAASRKCSAADGLGYRMGWPTGEANGTVAVAIICIK